MTDKTPEPANANVAALEDAAAVNEPTRYDVPGGERKEPEYARAKTELFANGVRAHVAGDLVPTVNVKKHGWKNDVEAL